MIQAADDIYQEWTGTKINRVSKKIEENKVPIIKHIPKPPSKPNLAKIYDNDPLKVRANTAYLPDIESPSTSNLQDTKNYMPVFERLSKPHVRKTKLNTQQYLPGIVYHDDKKPNYAYGSKYCLTFQPEKTGITKFKMIEALEFREKPSLMKAQTEIYKKTDRNSLIKILASNTSSLSQLKPKTIEFVDDRSKKWN